MTSLVCGVIGAPDDNLGSLDIDAGSACFFRRVTGVWIEDQPIVAGEPQTG